MTFRSYSLAMMAIVALWGEASRALPSTANRPPAPFVALAAGHIDMPYRDEVKSGFEVPVTQLRVTQGSLPRGLSLDSTTGVISGTPKAVGTAQLRIAGTSSSGVVREVRVVVSIFSRLETERIAGQNFENPGPYAVTRIQDTFSWESSFDQFPRVEVADIFVPAAAAGNSLPVFVFHRGRGFNYFDYSRFLSHLASWGIVCATLSDKDAFIAPGMGAPNSVYDSSRAELGMIFASSAQEAMMDQLLTRNSQNMDVLFGRMNPEAVFLAGHSRGGGATHASHQRSLALRLRGVIYFMPFELRYFGETIPPGAPPAYGIDTAMDRLPSLSISGSLDGDVVYPYADAFIDRATGPLTFVTLHRGIHNYLSDEAEADYPTTLSRDEQLQLIGHFVVTFIRRWHALDVSLDGQLYGSEWATSQRASVAYFRHSTPRLLVDDFQDADVTKNVLGGSPLLTNITRTEQTVYPSLFVDRFDSMNLKHSVVLVRKPTASYEMSLGTNPVDVRSFGVLEMRFKNDRMGFDYDAWVKLTDASGIEASVKVANQNGSSSGYFPSSPQNDNRFNRFRTLSIPLQAFATANRAFDFANVKKVTWVFAQANGVSLALDDIRFEGGPVFESVRVRNAADGRDHVAPLSRATIEGAKLAAWKMEATKPLPVELLGIRVWVEDSAGVSRAARLIVVSPTQLTFEVPANTALGQAWVRVELGTGVSVFGKVNVARVAPGLFSANGDGQGVAAGTLYRQGLMGFYQYEEIARRDPATGKASALPINLNDVSSRPAYLYLYGTGFRQAQTPPSVTLGGRRAQVTFAGPQSQFDGVDQVNVKLTPALIGKGTIEVQLTVDGQTSNKVTFDVR